MTRLLIVAHAPLASALKAVAEHTYPEARSVVSAIDVDPASSLQDLRDLVRSRLTDEPTLILCDTLGATPTNAVCQCLETGAWRSPDSLAVVTGVNVPMLWRALCYQSEPPVALARRAIEGGVRGMQLERGVDSPLSKTNVAKSDPSPGPNDCDG